MITENVRLEDVFIGRGGWRNFSGQVTEYNKSGDRKFTIFVPKDVADILLEQGWNVKTRDPYYEDGDVEYTLEIFIGYDHRAPAVKLIAHDGVMTYLDENTIGILDSTDIEYAVVEFRPYNWDVNGKTGVKAYLHELEVKAKAPRRALNARLSRRDDE